MLGAFPRLELLAYDTHIPGGWEERVQEVVNHNKASFASSVQVDMWDGITSVPGYRAIRWLDAVFYKSPQLTHDWDEALQYEARAAYSMLSQRMSGWADASSRVDVTPFAWINAGPSDFERARPPGYVADQLAAFRRWGTGGAFANYSYGPLGRFDYAPYASAMRAASRPGVVDRTPPRIAIAEPAGTVPLRAAGESFDLSGSASDNFAVRAIRWRDDHGHRGVAVLTPDTASSDGSAVSWSIRGIPLAPGRTTIWLRAVDIKRLSTVTSVRVAR
jgi:hypothetical protein